MAKIVTVTVELEDDGMKESELVERIQNALDNDGLTNVKVNKKVAYKKVFKAKGKKQKRP